MLFKRPAKPDTACARPAALPISVSEPLTPALQSSVVYKIASLDEVDALYENRAPGFFYARDSHPNLVQLSNKMAALEGAESAWAGSSGMAVEAALLLATVEAGDHVAVADGVYGKTGRLIAVMSRFGVSMARFDATRPESLRVALQPRTRLVFAETLSNPLVRLADIPGLANVTHDAGALLIIDHTFAPLLCQPLAMGADAVTHSATKLIGGHSDLTLGVAAGCKSLIDRAAVVSSTFGMTGNPYECWLCLRGLSTLAVRVRRACETALVLAQRLQAHSHVQAVHYPGLVSHADHERAVTWLQGGHGTIITIDLGSRDHADRFIRSLADVIPFAPSLGDVSTTLSHPATTSHRGQTADEWARQGMTPGLIRLSVGLEDAEDLWGELELALGLR